MNKFLILFACLISSTIIAFAAPPKVLFYVPFDSSINATAAGGNPQGTFGKGQTPRFAPGISGQGLISGGSNQHVVFDAVGNIPSDQWTITFWMKGLPGAVWNGGKYLQTFWELNGTGGSIMWFYKYSPGPSRPWLLSRQGHDPTKTFSVPKAPEEDWHYWAVSWRQGSTAYVYLDGRMVGQSLCTPPEHIKTIAIGQRENPSEQNKIIDEFKIYDTALGAASIAQHYWQEGNFALHPEITIAPTQHPITIDGKIGDEEWRSATGVTGFIDAQSWKMEAPQSWAKMTYDNQNLYVALHSDNPPEVKDHADTTTLYGVVKKDATQQDGDVKDDDHFFIQLAPDSSAQKYFSMRVNGLDTVEDAAIDNTGNADKGWQSGARVKSTFDANGWSMEMAIPLKSLGINAVSDGMTWRVNLGRVWKMLRQRTDIWAAGGRIDNETPTQTSGFGTVHFATAPDGTVDLRQFAIKPDGNIAAQMQLQNPNAAAREIHVALSANGKVLSQQNVSLAPNDYNHPVKLNALPSSALGSLAEVTVKDGAKVLLRQSAPVILQQVGQLALWSYPSRHQIRVGWVIQSNEKPGDLSLSVRINDAAGKTVQQQNIKSIEKLDGAMLLDIESLLVGKYTVNTQINNGEKVIQQQTIPWEKEPLPSWLGNTLGISDTPPPPWSNVQVDKTKDAISFWGRTYEYGGKLLPTQIINQGKPMLSAPMRLEVQSGSAATSTDAKNATAAWTQITPKRATSLRRQTLGNITFTADSYTEFDGMSWLTLTAAPQAPKVLLDGLTFDIPLKAEWAKLIRPADDYMEYQTGDLPADGWTGKVTSMPWVGNGNGGIQFFLESTAGWIGSKKVEIIPDGHGSVVMRVHLIDEKTTLDKPLQFSFGWIASPVKAAPKDSRDWRLISVPKTIESYITQSQKTNPNLKWYLPWWQNWWWLPDPKYKRNYDLTGSLPVPSGNGGEKAVRTYYGATFYAAPYGRLSQMGTDNPWFAQFGDEWVPEVTKFVPNTTSAPVYRKAAVSQAARSLRDFYAWGYNKLLTEGDVHALYFDVSRPVQDSNIYHGAGTVMPDRSIEPTYNILGIRKTFERIYTLMKAKHPDGKIFYHMSGLTILPTDSFSDALIDGENLTGRLDRKDNRGYENILPVDRFRAEFASQNNWGPASVLLPEFERAKSIKPDEWETLGYQHADYLLGLTLLHDSNIWWTWMPADHVAQVYSAFDATGWNAKWKFIPYWQQTYFSLPQGVYTSLYQSPDSKKVLLVIMNTSGKDQEIDLPMALGKSTFTSVKTVYPTQELTVMNGMATINITNNHFTAFLLEK